MALYTYDEEADALYVLLASEATAAIGRTIALTDRLHVDLDAEGDVVGVEILYPSRGGVDLEPVRVRFNIDLRIPFSFAA